MVKHTKKERRRKDRFVKLGFWLLDSEAWLALSSTAQAIYIRLAKRYNGRNNGEIAMSVREAAEEVGCSKNTAAQALKDLRGKGFIVVTTPSAFGWKIRRATEYRLTEFEFRGEKPTKDFMSWRASPAPKAQRKPSDSSQTAERQYTPFFPGRENSDPRRGTAVRRL